jgi:hypothetical protein
MSDSELAAVERALGHAVGAERAGSIRDLNDVPREVVEEARALDSAVLRYKFLRFLTADALRGSLPEFIEEVVDRGRDPREWRRGGILYPLIPLETLVTLQVPEILSVLEPGEDERWLQIAPARDMWEIGEAAAGAPALERPELRHDSTTSSRVRRVLLNGLEELWEVDDVTVATRRWMGSRIAWRASEHGGMENFRDGAALIRTLFPAVERPSDDAVISARGILREAEVQGPDGDSIPGFRGPVEWFE